MVCCPFENSLDIFLLHGVIVVFYVRARVTGANVSTLLIQKSTKSPSTNDRCTIRLHGSKIGVCIPTEIVCKLSVLTLIKCTFSVSSFNKDSIDYNKQRQLV